MSRFPKTGCANGSFSEQTCHHKRRKCAIRNGYISWLTGTLQINRAISNDIRNIGAFPIRQQYIDQCAHILEKYRFFIMRCIRDDHKIHTFTSTKKQQIEFFIDTSWWHIIESVLLEKLSSEYFPVKLNSPVGCHYFSYPSALKIFNSVVQLNGLQCVNLFHIIFKQSAGI